MSFQHFLPLQLNEISVVFNERTKPLTALDKLNLSISSHGITIILGSNGSGKTLLLKCCAELITATKGNIQWRQQPVPPELTLVPQQPVLLDRSVIENIQLPLQHNKLTDNKQNAQDALAWAGIQQLAQLPALTLSTGEQQLLALARAWALRPSILLLDEPTANLDPRRCEQINNLIQQLSLKCKVIMTSHNLAQTQVLANDIVLLDNGRLVTHSQAERFFKSSEYQHFLINEKV